MTTACRAVSCTMLIGIKARSGNMVCKITCNSRVPLWQHLVAGAIIVLKLHPGYRHEMWELPQKQNGVE